MANVNNQLRLPKSEVQVDLDIRGLLFCKFVYSHFEKLVKRSNFQSKCVFFSANLVFKVQYFVTYLPRITKLTSSFIKMIQLFSVVN
jgi:hypothetical protein